MTKRRNRSTLVKLVPLALALLASSCASLERNVARSTDYRKQANDSLTGGGQILLSAFRATAVAGVRQPITTLRSGLAMLWNRPSEFISGNLPLRLTSSPPPTAIPGTPEFESLLDDEGIPRPESGALTWLVDGPGFFSELDRQLATARRSIRIQLFIYDNDDIAVRYADRLKRHAEDVQVRILFDDLGSTFAHTAAPETPAPPGFTPPADIEFYLETDSKIRVRRTLNPWLVCDHTKLLIFDQRTAIIGGMNMGREYFSEWHDLMVKIEGPILETLSQEFDHAWRKAGPWGDLALFRTPAVFRRPSPVAGGIPLRLLRTDPAVGQHHILNATSLAIRAARKRVWIENPYFAHDGIARELEEAARRGVDVRVVLPARGDSVIMNAGNLGTARAIIQAGGKVYRYPRMTHMKAMICDGWAQVGSANLDTLSMRINRELNLAFSDPATLRRLEEQVFLPDFRVSKPIRIEETESPTAAFAESIADHL